MYDKYVNLWKHWPNTWVWLFIWEGGGVNLSKCTKCTGKGDGNFQKCHNLKKSQFGLVSYIFLTLNDMFYFNVCFLYCACTRDWQLWSWSFGSWIYNYLCNQYISRLWVRIPALMTRCTLQGSLPVTCRRFIGFRHHLNWPPRYNWNIVERGVKQYNHNPTNMATTMDCPLYENTRVKFFDKVIDLCLNFRYMDTSPKFVWLFTNEHEQVEKKNS